MPPYLVYFDDIPGAHPGSASSALRVERVTWGWPEVNGITTRGLVIVQLAHGKGSPG